MGLKTKINYLDQIELKVRDLAKEFIKSTTTSGSGTLGGGNTTFTVISTSGFSAGDSIYINDGSANSKFTTVNTILSATSIKVTGDFSAILSGASIKKTDGSQYLDEAINIFSKYRPYERIQKKTIDSPAQIFDLPDTQGYEWQDNFSSVNYIEYPVDNNPPIMLPENDFDILLNDSNAYKLHFAYALQTAYRISYNILHKWSMDNPAKLSIPDVDFYCLCNIAAGIYLLALASRYGQSVSNAIGADAINYDNKTDQYRRLAKVYFGQAAQWLGITVSALDGSDFEQQAASQSQSQEAENVDKKPTLFHSNQTPIINRN